MSNHKFKFAVLICGHLRSYKIAQNSLFHFLIDRLKSVGDVDIFVSTWDKSDSVDTPGGHEGKMKFRDDIDSSYSEIQKIYKTDYINIENYNYVREKFHYKNYIDEKPKTEFVYIVNDILIASAQLYHIFKCNELKKNIERQSGTVYDLVFRVRPDFDFCNFFDIDISDDLIIPYIAKGVGDDPNRPFAISDTFAYSSSKTMDIYAHTFLDLKYLINSWNSVDFPYNYNETLCQHLSLERIFHRQMVLNKINFRENSIILKRNFG